MFARHKLVWLTPDGWAAAAASAPVQQHAAIARWCDQDWPLIVRRREPDTAPDHVCLGLALPPDPFSGEKQRIALCVPAGGVARSSPALPIKQVLAALPAPQAGALAALAAEAVGLTLQVYGSVALQAVTGLPYVRPTSDIDLLLHPASDQQLLSGLALLEKYAKQLPLDGEIVFPRGQAVAWKEWAASTSYEERVLVKDIDAVRLMPRHLLAATLRAA